MPKGTFLTCYNKLKKAKLMMIYPDLLGLSFGSVKTPEFKTNIKQSLSGYEARTTLRTYPLWNFQLSYEFLRTDTTINELKALVGFYLQCKGSYDTFLYKDAYDNVITNQIFGIGNGSSKNFQLIRDFGGFVDLIQAPDTSTLNVMINGVTTTAYTVTNGVIIFNTAPANGATLSWSGNFYFPCRFTNDELELTHFMRDLWEAKKVNFVSVKL